MNVPMDSDERLIFLNGFPRGDAACGDHHHMPSRDDRLQCGVELWRLIYWSVNRRNMDVPNRGLWIFEFRSHGFDFPFKDFLVNFSRAVPRSMVRVTECYHFMISVDVNDFLFRIYHI